MAQFTMEIRQIVENNTLLFDFDYPIFDEAYRPHLEERIINHFYFREIGVWPIGRFKHYLKEFLNLKMPYYNKLYETTLLEQRILDNYDVTETFTKEVGTTSTQEEQGTGTGKQLFSDTPQSRVTIGVNDFITNITENSASNTNNSIINGEVTEQWTRKMQGNIGVQTDADAILKYRQSLLNVDELILEKMNYLFMGVY